MPSFPYLPSALPSVFTFIKIITNLTLNTSIFSLVIKVRISEALNFNIRVLFKAGDSLLKTSNYRVSSLKAFL